MEKQRVVDIDQEIEVCKMDKYGIYVIYHFDTNGLFSVPMLKDGSPELILEDQELTLNTTEITAPESQEFLNDVNVTFDTNFTLNQFTGR